MYQTLIPSEEERQKSKGMQDMGKGWFVGQRPHGSLCQRHLPVLHTVGAAAWAPMLILFVRYMTDDDMAN